MDLDEGTFNLMSWEQYCYKSYGYMVRQAREWERTRSIMWMLFNANCKQGEAKSSPNDLFSLMTDEKEEVTPIAQKISHAERLLKARQMQEKMNKQAAEKWTQDLKLKSGEIQAN